MGGLERPGRQRRASGIALKEVAPGAGKPRALRLGPDPSGDDRKPERPGHADDHMNQRLAVPAIGPAGFRADRIRHGPRQRDLALIEGRTRPHDIEADEPVSVAASLIGTTTSDRIPCRSRRSRSGSSRRIAPTSSTGSGRSLSSHGRHGSIGLTGGS
jgi:hypothetical protein